MERFIKVLTILYIIFLFRDSLNLERYFQTYPIFLLISSIYIHQKYYQNFILPYSKCCKDVDLLIRKLFWGFILFVILKLVLSLVHLVEFITISLNQSFLLHFILYFSELYFYY